MTYQERKSLTEIISSILILGIYSLIMYQRYQNGLADTSDVFVYWSKFMLILIPITIAAKIIITIVFTILNSIVAEIKGEEEDNIHLIDERDKLIELKSMRNSLIVFSLGFIIALASQLLGASNHGFFIILVLFGLLSDVLGGVSSLLYYRRGV